MLKGAKIHALIHEMHIFLGPGGFLRLCLGSRGFYKLDIEFVSCEEAVISYPLHCVVKGGKLGPVAV